jgi:2-oxo-hept-3-ene-1,7-dioate hydratase
MATAAQIAALADRIAEARRAHQVMDFMAGALNDMTEAEAYHVQFAVQERVGRHDPLAGWKVALAVPALYQPAGLTAPALAGIYKSGLRRSPAPIPAGTFHKYGIECEVVAVMARDCPPGKTYDANSIRDYVANLHCGMEIVENRFADLAKVDGKGRVADDVLQGACVIGPEIKNWREVDLAKPVGRCAFEGKELAGGPGANVMGGPLVSLAWLANRLIHFGKQLKAGDTILTGSTHPPQFLNGPGRAVAIWEGLGETVATFA